MLGANTMKLVCHCLVGNSSWTGQSRGLTVESQQAVVQGLLWCEQDDLCAGVDVEQVLQARELLSKERATLGTVQIAQKRRGDGGKTQPVAHHPCMCSVVITVVMFSANRVV
jgi:hypothetical protein